MEEAFDTYARSRRISINYDAIEPRRFPGRGLGIAATRKIEKGTVLIHVPLSALVMPWSTSTVSPEQTEGRSTHNDNDDDDGVTVRSHAKLAARVAFGDMRGHEAWQATWPTLRDFQTCLPLLWPERTRELYCRSCAGQTAVTGLKRSKGPGACRHGGAGGERFAILPPALTGLWATVPLAAPLAAAGSEIKATSSETDGKPLLPSQRAKFTLDLTAARHLYPDLDLDQAETLDRFTWAWCIVNTRCFYYVAPGTEPPADSDEAMVLCPGIDLFNHTSHGGCEVTYDDEGFWARAERTYEAGEELVTNYGAHGEDTLMAEYGFLMGGASNEWDGVGIDGVVLATLEVAEKKLLEEYGFLSGYTMRRDGLCWRTEVAARCVVMEEAKWDRFVAGRWTDLEDEKLTDGQRRSKASGRMNGVSNGKGKGGGSPKQMATRQLRTWVEQVKKEAENSLDGLQALTNDDVSQLFEAVDTTTSPPGTRVEGDLDQAHMAAARHDMVIRRWTQILETSCAALDSLGG